MKDPLRPGVSVFRSTAEFLRHLGAGLKVVWPVFSGIVGLVMLLGVAVGYLENWSYGNALYFAMITALTIGYGDLVPTTGLARFFAVMLGVLGFLSTSILAALAVHALRQTIKFPQDTRDREDS